MKICIIGASGRIGNLLAEYVSLETKHSLAGLIDHKDSQNIGKSYNGIKYTDNIKNPENIDIFIDFSTSQSTILHLEAAILNKKPYVIGTTGFNDSQIEIIKNASKTIPIILSYNFSYGVLVMQKALKILASNFGTDFDIEIIESHHRNKVDSPSGTALMLADTIKLAQPNKHTVTKERFDQKQRQLDEIGMQSIRGGNIFGEHEIKFISDNEEIYIGHKAFNRKIFAIGAIKAAEWLVNKNAGLYELENII